MAGRSLRGEAAIVGVADAVSPTGELDTRGHGSRRRWSARRSTTPGSPSPTSTACAAPASPRGTGRVPRHPPRGSSTARSSAARASRCTSSTRRRPSPPGLCDVVVSVYAATPRQRPQARRGGARGAPAPCGPNPAAEWELPTACACRWASYALAASRHMAQYGTTSEQLGPDRGRHAAVGRAEPPGLATRTRSPSTTCWRRPLQASPLHQLDCCLVTDGAGAFVMTSAERARDLRQAAGVRARRRDRPRPLDDQRRCPTSRSTTGAISGPAAFAMAGRHARRRRRADGLRLVHHHRAPAPRGPRVLRQGRGRRRSSRTASSVREVRCR